MSTLERLQEVFRDVFDDEDIVISNETTADDIEGWDSLTHVVLIVAVQDEFDIKFSIAETNTLKNIGDFIKLIDNKIQGK
ncbi:MAG: acyl carrier protein [Lachnospiraceae bacterium]|nr:acyl carrier protein [Lachnospiraceae bacterium]